MTTWLDRIQLGSPADTTLYSLYYRLGEFRKNREDFTRFSHEEAVWVMGYSIPPFQRGDVWSEEQMVRFVESANRGLFLGTYTVNASFGLSEAKRIDEKGNEYYYGDGWLLDGRQRLTALQTFFDDGFKVKGMLWSEIPENERRGFLMNTKFTVYETRLSNDLAMRELYDLMNFGGTVHELSQRALPALKI